MGRSLAHGSDIGREGRLYIENRWGPVAVEMLRQAKIASFIAENPHQRVYPGTTMDRVPDLWIPDPTPLAADEAKAAWRHLGEALGILEGRIMPTYERHLRQLFEGLGRYNPPRGRRPLRPALFARRMLEWVETSLHLQGVDADELPRFNSTDLVRLAQFAEIERKAGPDIDEKWRGLHKANNAPQRRR